ncbi:MAG: hypothetical protein SVV80_14565 [Planctomycetota bacterium]|nr:hypothetical protein [Planctomycetota bacterium]
MDVINAIAKIRFSSAKAQRVHLHHGGGLACDLLCLEPGQEFSSTGQCSYYLIAGAGVIKAGKTIKGVNMGNFATCEEDESHTLVNSSEQRLICMVISPHH